MGTVLMKTCHRSLRAGATLLKSLFVAIAVIILGFVAVLLLSLTRVRGSANRLTCVNNLKQVGLAFRIYAGDYFDRYPMNISTNDKPVVDEMTPVYRYFQLISNELGTPKVVVCPSDMRLWASNFTNFGNGNVSYFIGLDGHKTLPKSILAGDRNITNGFAAKDGILQLTTKQKVRFTDEIHLKQGNIALGDGSVQHGLVYFTNAWTANVQGDGLGWSA